MPEPRHYLLAVAALLVMAGWVALAAFRPVIGMGLLGVILVVAVVRMLAEYFADRMPDA